MDEGEVRCRYQCSGRWNLSTVWYTKGKLPLTYQFYCSDYYQILIYIIYNRSAVSPVNFYKNSECFSFIIFLCLLFQCLRSHQPCQEHYSQVRHNCLSTQIMTSSSSVVSGFFQRTKVKLIIRINLKVERGVASWQIVWLNCLNSVFS